MTVQECLEKCRTRCFAASPAGLMPPLTDMEALARYQEAAMALIAAHENLQQWMVGDGMNPADPVHAIAIAAAAASETLPAGEAIATEF
ncbi:hypothetical protein [Sphingopyxis sp. H115]|uniref:hypothetical protein n=1 Tax=Sphingopyxis sp. H115 TaxID=1759073 RepID=UPI000737168F|nr:hypothetical protein [Sphingopyxis sp. H115]KTE03383.1 hypothetical protein ATE71_19655 [Sphingopyxis sp. H115]